MRFRFVSLLSRNYSTSVVMKTNASTRKYDYDIIISGGGMIGSSLACILSRNPMLKNHKILLIEGAKKKEWKLSKNYSNRVSALNYSTKSLLESVGIWKHIAEARFKSVKHMKIWGVGSEAAVEFETKGSNSNDVAFIVENDVLLAGVDKELDKLKDFVTVIHGSKIKDYELPCSSVSQPVSVLMEDGKKYSCSLLLGTDGVNSKVREKMGVEHIKWNYNQSAVVATLELEQVPQNDTAWQRFLTTGPVALLPLTNELSSLVWSTTTDDAKRLINTTNDDFVHALNSALTDPPQSNGFIDFAKQVTELASKSLNVNIPAGPVPIPPTIKAVQDGSRASFPLGFGHASSYVRPGVALLGDAAHRVHPLAGQGVNLGFGDIECLTRILANAVSNGKVINSYDALKEYEKLRLRHNLPTMIAIDVMNKVYSSSNDVLMALGHIAIQFTNCASPLKNLMIKQASS